MECLKLTYKPVFELRTHGSMPSREAKVVQMFTSVGALTVANIGGAVIHQVTNFDDYLIYPSGYVVVDPGKDEYSKHYYINGKRFVSRLEQEASQFTVSSPQGYGAFGSSATANNTIDTSELMGTQNTTYNINIGNDPIDCLNQINNIVTAYENLNIAFGGAIQECEDAIKAIRNQVNLSLTPCQALILINEYRCSPQDDNTPGSTLPPSFTAEEILQFDCLTELNILIAEYTGAAERLTLQRMMPFGNFKYGCSGLYEDLTCCIRFTQTGIWDCPECPELTLQDCAIIDPEEQTQDWKNCIKDCLENSNHPDYGDICWQHFENTGEWLDDCFMLLLDCEHCIDFIHVEAPDQEEIDCLIGCHLEDMVQCLESYNDLGIWTKECQDLSIECGCREEEVEEEDEMIACAADCPNPMATECAQHFIEYCVWLEDCEEVMRDCGCYDPDDELDCYKKALNYIRKNLTFEPNNSCMVLNYVKTHFQCNTRDFVDPGYTRSFGYTNSASN